MMIINVFKSLFININSKILSKEKYMVYRVGRYNIYAFECILKLRHKFNGTTISLFKDGKRYFVIGIFSLKEIVF